MPDITESIDTISKAIFLDWLFNVLWPIALAFAIYWLTSNFIYPKSSTASVFNVAVNIPAAITALILLIVVIGKTQFL